MVAMLSNPQRIYGIDRNMSQMEKQDLITRIWSGQHGMQEKIKQMENTPNQIQTFTLTITRNVLIYDLQISFSLNQLHLMDNIDVFMAPVEFCT